MSAISLQEAVAPLVLALDIGTSSARVLLFDAQARHVRGVEGRASYHVHTTPDGGAELDADAVFEALCHCVDHALEQIGTRQRDIAAVGACSLASSLVGVAGETAVTPVYTWADTRPAEDAERLKEEVDVEAVHERTGCLIHPSYLPPRFLWLERTQPELLAQVERWMSLSEYIHLRLFGRAVCSYSIASWTGLLNRHSLTWDSEWLRQLPIDEAQLSPLGDVDTPLTGLRSPFAERWPALAGIPWFPALGDGAGSNVGSGCTTPTRIAVNAGTSGAMRVVLPGTPERVPSGLWCYRVDRRRSLLGGALSNVGNVYQWLRQTLQLGAPEEIEAQLAAANADAHGLTVLPFLAGERAPGWAGHARAAFTGIGWHTRPIDILQAGLEAVAYRYALIYELVSQAVPAAREVIVSGGAMLSSPAWTQILCDVLGRPVIASAEPEATSRGAALLALEAIGAIRDIDELPPALGRSFEPRMDRHEIYRAAIDRQRALYVKLVMS